MNEFDNVSTVDEQSANQQDAFLEGWGDDESPDTVEPADQQDAQEGAASEEQEPAADGVKADGDQPAQVETETTAQPEQEDPAAVEAKEASKTWTLKHMGEEKTLSTEDITPELLQKGLDYDRVRGKYDEAKPVVELMAQYAKQAGMSLADYTKHIREEAKKAGGMTAEEAKRTVELEDREAAVRAKESARQEQEKNEADRKAKVAADLAEFERAFPDIYARAKSDPNAIPKSVWDEVNGGRFSLTAAYSRYAVAQATQAAAAEAQVRQTEAQNRRNADRSTGSMKSAGSDTKSYNAFLDGFDNG